jgi:hypothetical protein
MPRKKRMKRRGRPSALSRMTITDLMREVERRRGMLGTLVSQRDQLQRELEVVDGDIAELESLGGGGAGIARRGPGRPRKNAGRPRASGGTGRRGGRRGERRGGRGGNAQSLAQALHGLLQGRTLGVAEMSEAVRKAGYKTKSPNFRTIVNAALIANKSMFKKVARGQYTAK